jgi:hypothetical protein
LELGALLTQWIDDDGKAEVAAAGGRGVVVGGGLGARALFVVLRYRQGVGGEAAVAVAVFLFGAGLGFWRRALTPALSRSTGRGRKSCRRGSN